MAGLAPFPGEAGRLAPFGAGEGAVLDLRKARGSSNPLALKTIPARPAGEAKPQRPGDLEHARRILRGISKR